MDVRAFFTCTQVLGHGTSVGEEVTMAAAYRVRSAPASSRNRVGAVGEDPGGRSGPAWSRAWVDALKQQHRETAVVGAPETSHVFTPASWPAVGSLRSPDHHFRPDAALAEYTAALPTSAGLAYALRAHAMNRFSLAVGKNRTRRRTTFDLMSPRARPPNRRHSSTRCATSTSPVFLDECGMT